MQKAHNKKHKNKKYVGEDASVCPKHQRNTQKGITLIALIITIIVLLILAVVSIRLVVNTGILGKAESGVSKYQEAEADEQEQLLKAEYEMAKYEGKFSGTYTDYVLDKKYGVKIGDYVAYTEAGFGDYTADTSKGVGRNITTFNSTTKRWDLTAGDAYKTNDDDLNWRVLGVNAKGELELISDNPTTNSLFLANEEGYLNAETVGDKKGTLDTFCNTLYGNGTGSTGKVVATGARSLNVDDINQLGNYKPTTYSDYGSLWQYQFPSGGTYLQYRKSTDNGATWTKWTNIPGTESRYQKFRMPGADSSTTISSTNPGISETLKNTCYEYTISNYVTQTTSDGKSMADIITKGTGTSDISQWLASSDVGCDSYSAEFGIRIVFNGDVRDCYFLVSNYTSHGTADYRVRPVVYLKSDIQIEKTETNDGSTLAKACIIK